MLSRRQLIKLGGAFSLASQAPYLMAQQGGGELILGGGRILDTDTQKISYFISCLDTSLAQPQVTETNFLPHGLHPNPAKPTQLAVFEKKGPGACEYDLETRQLVRMIEPTDGCHFYGHGAYSVDGEVLFSTENHLLNNQGLLSIRDSKTLQSLGQFPSYGQEPHECKLIDGGKVLVVTNGGGPLGGEVPSVCYIDVNSQKLLEKIEVSDKYLNAGHLAIDNNGSLVTVSAPRSGLGRAYSGGISVVESNGRFVRLSHPGLTENLKGEALSVCIHNRLQILAVTHPTSQLVSFWSIRTQQLIKTLSFVTPRGIELNKAEDEFLITAGETASLYAVSIPDLEVKRIISPYSYFTGSHIYNWARRLPEINIAYQHPASR